MTGISKNQIKNITELSRKKKRIEKGLFVAEGMKTVQELLQSSVFKLLELWVLPSVSSVFENELCFEISEKELAKISQLKNPQKVLAVFEIPKLQKMELQKGLILVLDGIADPGNLGTMIRLCDWFGIKQIICSEDTVDCYNPKVIQATMGSIARVQLHYLEVPNLLKQTKRTIYATQMAGQNVYQTTLEEDAFLVMGNEANGIRDTVRKYCTQTLSIPRFGEFQKTESLNVATATAILLSEFKRGK